VPEFQMSNISAFHPNNRILRFGFGKITDSRRNSYSSGGGTRVIDRRGGTA